MKLRKIISGIASFVPGIDQLRAYIRGTWETGGTDSARYCYSIWLRHMVMAQNNGLNIYPKIVAELGPGDSLGIGLAALISGCDKYYALDVVEHANTDRNVKIFDELVTLFKNRTPIPGKDEFPEITPHLENHDFPVDIFDDNRLQHALEQSRIERIRDSISNPRQKDSLIQYKVPWNDISTLEKESVDMIYSQAVLEHVDDLRNTYRAMHSWLKSDGYMSHTIDFRSHGPADEWNGHWAYSDFMWKIIRGKQAYLINREPHSTHIELLIKEDFKILCDIQIKSESSFARNELAPRFRSISADDLTTSTAFIQGVKKTGCNSL